MSPWALLMHAGAIEPVQSHTMVKIVGTSTCDIVVTPQEDIGQ